MDLTTWEREAMRMQVGAMGNLSLAQFRLGLALMDKLELTAEEKQEVGYYEVPGAGNGWVKVRVWGVELTADEVGLATQALQAVVAQKNQLGQWSPLADRHLLAYCDKMGVELEYGSEEQIQRA
jgi:hypothetical protein